MAAGAVFATTVSSSSSSSNNNNNRTNATCLPITITCLLQGLLLLLALDGPGTRVQASRTYTECGGWIRGVNNTKGYIQTPNFPHRFPVPISCKWALHAPPGKKIVLYFTQNYLRESFEISEYAHYENDSLYVDKTTLEEMDIFDLSVLTGYKPYLVIHFKAHEIGNIHLRVDDFLLDVYGFNITYEIVDDDAEVREDACTVYMCSFLGNCMASENFETYRCHCFPKFFGDECQYGPHCNPDVGINQCENGGECR